MSPHTTRRSYLHAIGATTLGGLAGCIKSGGPETTTGSQSTPNQDNNDGTQTNGGTTREQATTVTGRTYDITVQNALRPDEMKSDHNYDSLVPAKFEIAAYRNPDEGEDTILFEKNPEIPPDSTQTYEDAFSTEPDGTQYVLKATLTNLQKGAIPSRLDFEKYYRFTPGGFQWPSGDTLSVTVQNAPDQPEGFLPFFTVDAES